MTIHRFHLRGVAGPGVVALDEAASRHAARVLRLEVGDALRVFDEGAEFEACIASIEKQRVLVEVGASIVPLHERATRMRLIMSPLKGDLTELVIQKATELGVSRISPVVFERTDTVARRDPGETRRERWHRVAVGAAEQSGRAVVPTIDALLTLGDAVAGLGTPVEHEARIVAAEPSLDRHEGKAPGPEIRAVVVAVGPAGGLSAGDLECLDSSGFTSERFALHTLRAETACIAAVAILGARFR